MGLLLGRDEPAEASILKASGVERRATFGTLLAATPRVFGFDGWDLTGFEDAHKSLKDSLMRTCVGVENYDLSRTLRPTAAARKNYNTIRKHNLDKMSNKIVVSRGRFPHTLDSEYNRQPQTYRSVIDDVINSIRSEFDEYGVSEDVLGELQSVSITYLSSWGSLTCHSVGKPKSSPRMLQSSNQITSRPPTQTHRHPMLQHHQHPSHHSRLPRLLHIRHSILRIQTTRRNLVISIRTMDHIRLLLSNLSRD